MPNPPHEPMTASLARLDDAAALVRTVVPPTPQYCWALLSRRLGAELWVKHENHTPIGAFKLRGGLVYLDELRRSTPQIRGVITATRGNHGQSIAYAAARAAAERLHLVRSFDPALVRGVASCGLELFRAVAGLDTVYVPIGLGSGICAMIAAREALGERAEIVGVVAANAPTYALSLAAGRPVSTNSADTIADGLAVRVPDDAALAIIRAGAARIVAVSEAEIRRAMRILFSDTHNVAEGAGAAALAAALQERGQLAGKRVAIVQSGGNIDRALFAEVLAEADVETAA